MARHRKDFAGERLSARLTVQLTPADRAALDAAAAEIGQPVSDFARDWMLQGVQSTAKARALIVPQQTVDRQMTAELVGHGQALNELAKLANESQEIGDPDAVRSVVAALVMVIDRIDPVTKEAVRISTERRILMNEVTRIGNNFMQLLAVACARRNTDITAVLAAAEERIVAYVERIISI